MKFNLLKVFKKREKEPEDFFIPLDDLDVPEDIDFFCANIGLINMNFHK